MYLFNPASTTYVKHFISTTQRMYYSSVYTQINERNSILIPLIVDAIQFSITGNNIK